MDWRVISNAVLKYGRKYTPAVLIGAGTVMSIRAIMKVEDVIDESRRLEDEAIQNKIDICEKTEDRQISREELDEFDLTTWEKIQTCWPAWVPVIWREALALGCFYAAYGIKDRRLAVASLLALAFEQERDDLDRALRERLKPDEYEECRHEIISNRMQKAFSGANEIAVGPDEALAIYYEPVTGKKFKADPRDIQRVIKELDEAYLVNGYVPLSDFFAKLKIDVPDVAQYIGWQYEPGYGSIKYRTYQYYWSEKDIYITGLDLGLKLDAFVKTWY